MLAGLAGAGCGDDGGSPDAATCGPGSAPASGLVAGAAGLSLTYGGLRGGINNDCPAADAPAGVISLSIHGATADATGLVTLCISRPDLLATQPQALGLAAGARARLIDLTGSANGCTYAIDPAQPATGTITASGLCGNGGDAAGFAVTLDGTLSLTRTCGATVDSLPVTLRGNVAVAKQ